MLRFSDILEKGLRKKGADVSCWRPFPLAAYFLKDTKTGTAKWIGYLDKWALYPFILICGGLLINLKTRGKHRFHICDHSNSLYIDYLPVHKTSITCHDVLAIRGALGHKDAFCEPTPAGKRLQQMILEHLVKVEKIACVSGQTLKQLNELIGNKGNKKKRLHTVIHNPLNAAFGPDPENIEMLHGISPALSPRSYLLHVGSDHPRKNRELLIKLLFEIKDEWPGKVVFAGEPLGKDIQKSIESFGLENRAINLVGVSHEALVCLYNHCFAFVFPSFSEGFGWPLVEAQACGAPVLTSDREPMWEVAGRAALFANPDDTGMFKSHFRRLLEPSFREETIEKGFANSKRFEETSLIDAYLSLILGTKHP